MTLLDTRTPGEYAGGHAEGFVNIPVDELRDRLNEIPAGKPVVCHVPERPAELCGLPHPGPAGLCVL